MACADPLSARFHWVGADCTSSEGNTVMVNEWSRDDLPSVIKSHRYGNMHFSRIQEVEAYKDDVVDHLNAHHPKSTPGLLSNAADCVLDAEDRASAAKSEVALWRRAHELVERERDQARRERDEWKARAEAAEGRLAAPVAAPENVEADPAVFVVRESDIAAIHVERDADGDWVVDKAECFSPTSDLNRLREYRDKLLRSAAVREAVARAIEAGQAVDPLLDKAQEFAALADWELTDREAELLHAVAAHVLGQEAGQ